VETVAVLQKAAGGVVQVGKASQGAAFFPPPQATSQSSRTLTLARLCIMT
jgi:hypothetical protein